MRNWLMMALLLAGGCAQADLAEMEGPEEGRLFGASAMRIHPIFSNVKDWTGDGNVDGIEVLVEFQDQFGDPTKAAGTVMFELYDYREGNPDPRGGRMANPWIGSISTLDEQRARWNRTSRTYTFQLAYPKIAEHKNYVLTAMFRSAEGGRFFDRTILEGEEEPKGVENIRSSFVPSRP